ncbi:MAG: hypothetical protein ACK559_31560, partial [bacterium]
VVADVRVGHRERIDVDVDGVTAADRLVADQLVADADLPRVLRVLVRVPADRAAAQQAGLAAQIPRDADLVLPVDAHVLPLEPRAVVVVLFDDVGLDAVDRVVRAADVEVALDVERDDDVLLARVRRVAARDALIG